MPTKSLFFYDSETQYTITFHPTHIDFRSDDKSFVIRPQYNDKIILFALMPDIPPMCEINRARSIPFSLLPSIISYSIEKSLMSIHQQTFCNQIKFTLDPHLVSIMSPYGIMLSDSIVSCVDFRMKSDI